mgnify:CR=1 FL=1
MFSLVLHQDRRKSYLSSRDKWLCKQASSHLSLWTTKSIAFAKDFLPEKTCKLLRRLLYRNGFVLCSILASPIFVWRNGVWQRRKLFHRPYPRFPNLYRCKKIQKKNGNVPARQYLEELFTITYMICSLSENLCRKQRFLPSIRANGEKLA